MHNANLRINIVSMRTQRLLSQAASSRLGTKLDLNYTLEKYDMTI